MIFVYSRVALYGVYCLVTTIGKQFLDNRNYMVSSNRKTRTQVARMQSIMRVENKFLRQWRRCCFSQ